jgi:hypothetical protein
VTRPSGISAPGAPRLLLGLYGLHRRGSRRTVCAPRDVRARVGGRDLRNVRRVAFLYGPRLGLRRVYGDERPPFLLRLPARSLESRRYYRVTAQIALRDGRRLVLTRTFRAC